MVAARVAGVPSPQSFIAWRSSASSISLPASSIAESSVASVNRRGGWVSLASALVAAGEWLARRERGELLLIGEILVLVPGRARAGGARRPPAIRPRDARARGRRSDPVAAAGRYVMKGMPERELELERKPEQDRQPRRRPRRPWCARSRRRGKKRRRSGGRPGRRCAARRDRGGRGRRSASSG